MNNKMLITNIQRFSLHDGPGIRTTIFMKGCSLHCPWCSNPENINPFPEIYIKDGFEGVYGKEYTVEEVFYEIKKDKTFYENGGGITLSGGEALLQAEEILPLLRKCKEENITTAVETCLFVPTINLELVIPFIDYFYVDMKIMDTKICNERIRGSLSLYKRNLDTLSAVTQFNVRIPVISGFTDTDDNRRLIINEVGHYKKSIIGIELIKGHNLGDTKYKSLGLPVPKYTEVSDGLLKRFKDEIRAVVDIPVTVCKF